MSCETFKTTLGGVEYTYTQLPASKSLELKLRLVKILGASLPLLFEGRGKTDIIQTQYLADAITKTLVDNSPCEVSVLITDCIKTVQVGDSQIDPDQQFSGDLIGLYTLMYWVLKKEYGSFLAAVIDLFGEPTKSVKKTGLKSISQI